MITFIAQQRFLELRPALQEQLRKMAGAITPANFSDLCDPQITRLIERTFASVQATEGSIWLVDAVRENLVIAYNNGPNAKKVVGFRQPLSKGLVSLTFANEQALVENEVYKNADHDHELNQRLQQTTYAMIVVPFYFADQLRGVITCVQLIDVFIAPGQVMPVGSTPLGFNRKDLLAIQDGALILRDLVDLRLLHEALGWNT